MAMIFENVKEWQLFRNTGLFHNKTVGFVPTMGALHEGHRSLLLRARKENHIVVASIFVNPTQFNDPTDLSKYPRTLEPDLAMLREVGVDYLLYPQMKDIYPDDYRYKVTENTQSKTLCGAHRPGHFDGVLTVVMRLLNLVNPTRTYFGEKDYQQLELVQGMVRAFFMKTEVIPCPTFREEDGLAMSSRNRLLKDQERTLAAAFPKILGAGEDLETTKQKLQDVGFEVDYVEDRDHRRFGAVKIGNVRLIDNLRI